MRVDNGCPTGSIPVSPLHYLTSFPSFLRPPLAVGVSFTAHCIQDSAAGASFVRTTMYTKKIKNNA